MGQTEIPGRYIKDGSIDNDKIAAGAGIETSKLAEGADFIQRDGSVPMTGNFDAGNQKIVNLQTPSASGDGATKGYVDTQISALGNLFANKYTVRAASTANVTVSNPGTASFDGVTLSTGDLLLLKNQSTASQNGIYVFDTSGTALVRASVMDAWSEVPGALVIVQEGSTLADTFWLSTANQGGTLGTTAIAFTQANTGGSGLTDSNFVVGEALSGTVNGSNTVFTTANNMTSGSEEVFIGGVRLRSGSGNDYEVTAANEITFATAPLTGEVPLINYRK